MKKNPRSNSTKTFFQVSGSSIVAEKIVGKSLWLVKMHAVQWSVIAKASRKYFSSWPKPGDCLGEGWARPGSHPQRDKSWPPQAMPLERVLVETLPRPLGRRNPDSHPSAVASPSGAKQPTQFKPFLYVGQWSECTRTSHDFPNQKGKKNLHNFAKTSIDFTYVRSQVRNNQCFFGFEHLLLLNSTKILALLKQMCTNLRHFLSHYRLANSNFRDF